MNIKVKQIVISTFLILTHLLGFGLHDLFHNDDIYFSLSSGHQLSTHEDADHCKHIPLDERADCPISASHQSRITSEQNTFDIDQLQIVDKIEIVPSVPLFQTHLFGSFTRRGPPSPLG